MARNYQQEYQRRQANAAAKGLSRSQGRGHARSGEQPIRASKKPASDERLETGLKILRQTGNQSEAAKEAGVAPERLRRFLLENGLAQRVGKEWRFDDQRPRIMKVWSGGAAHKLTLTGFDDASLAGKHQAAVKSFLRTNDLSLLTPFEGRSVIDNKGVRYVFETDPNALHRIAASGSEVFHQIYRLVN